MTKERVHELSSATSLPEFDYFGVPQTQEAVDMDMVRRVLPRDGLQGGGPIEFIIENGPNEFLLFYETYLKLKLKVKLEKTAGGAVTEADYATCFPENYLLHSFFKQVEITIGDKIITMSSQTYPYRAYIETLLGCADTVKKTYLTASKWCETEAEQKLLIKPATPGNEKTITMKGRLHTDLTMQSRAMLGGLTIKIKLFPHEQPEFYMRAATGFSFKVSVDSAQLEVHKAKVTKDLFDGINTVIRSNHIPAKFPITRTIVKEIALSTTTLDHTIPNIVTGQLPRRAFFFMVDNEALNGSYTKDPFLFKNNGLIQLSTYIDGFQYPELPLTPDFENNQFEDEYLALFQVLNQNGTDCYLNIDPATFKDKKCIFAVNFAPDLSNGPGASGHINPIQRGQLSAYLKFKSVLTTSTSLLVFLEFDNIIEIDEDQQVATGYN